MFGWWKKKEKVAEERPAHIPHYEQGMMYWLVNNFPATGKVLTLIEEFHANWGLTLYFCAEDNRYYAKHYYNVGGTEIEIIRYVREIENEIDLEYFRKHKRLEDEKAVKMNEYYRKKREAAEKLDKIN